jgi:hypothetical protein
MLVSLASAVVTAGPIDQRVPDSCDLMETQLLRQGSEVRQGELGSLSRAVKGDGGGFTDWMLVRDCSYEHMLIFDL